MTSRDSEPRRSMGPPLSADAYSTKQRGPNPQTDYKKHFNRTKERFDLVNTEQANRKKELDRASLKQAKLQEELEYLLDAIASERMQANHLRQALETSHSPLGDYDNQGQPEEIQVSGEELEEYEDGDEVMQRQEDTSMWENRPKRQRPSPADTEDELLETAGVPTKKSKYKPMRYQEE